MATVYWNTRKDGSKVLFVVHRVDGRRVSEKVGSVSPKASKRKRRMLLDKAAKLSHERRCEIDGGTFVDPRELAEKRLTFKQLVGRFLQHYPSRSDYYRQRASIWLSHLPPDRQAARITVADVDRLRRARMHEGASASTIRKDLTSLSTLFRWAQARGHVDDNPASLVKRPPEPRPNGDYLTPEAIERLLAVCSGWLRLFTEWALSTGMDRQEIIDLSWRDVDRRAGIVHAPRAKTGQPRDIPITDTLKGILDRAKSARSLQSGGRVFLGFDGKKLHTQAVKTALRRAYAAADLDGYAPAKTLRHTFASRLAMAGVDMQSIAKLMGHSHLATTERYAHLSPGHLREAMEALDGPKLRLVKGERRVIDFQTRLDGMSRGQPDFRPDF